MTKEVYGFWIRGELNINNLLTIRSFQDKGYKFIIYSYVPNLTNECKVRDANEIMPRSEGYLYKGFPSTMELGGFGDKLRSRMLYKLGGWHSDLDITLLKPLSFDSEYVFRPHNLGVVPSLIKCPKESKVAQYYMNLTNNIDYDKPDWEGSFRDIIIPIKEESLEQYIAKDEIFGRDDWNWWKPMIWTTEAKPNSERVAIHWVDSTGYANNYTNHIEGSYFRELLKQYNLI